MRLRVRRPRAKQPAGETSASGLGIARSRSNGSPLPGIAAAGNRAAMRAMASLHNNAAQLARGPATPETEFFTSDQPGARPERRKTKKPVASFFSPTPDAPDNAFASTVYNTTTADHQPFGPSSIGNTAREAAKSKSNLAGAAITGASVAGVASEFLPYASTALNAFKTAEAGSESRKIGTDRKNLSKNTRLNEGQKNDRNDILTSAQNTARKKTAYYGTQTALSATPGTKIAKGALFAAAGVGKLKSMKQNQQDKIDAQLGDPAAKTRVVKHDPRLLEEATERIRRSNR